MRLPFYGIDVNNSTLFVAYENGRKYAYTGDNIEYAQRRVRALTASIPQSAGAAYWLGVLHRLILKSKEGAAR